MSKCCVDVCVDASDGFKWTQVLERSTSNDCVVIDLKGSMDADIRCMEMMGLNRFKRSICCVLRVMGLMQFCTSQHNSHRLK